MTGYELGLAFLAIAIYLAGNGSKLLSVSQSIYQKNSNEVKKTA
jgi:putative oxidoreductase